MFKKVKCTHCKKDYDETFGECPNCHSPNEKLDPNFKKIQMFSYIKQIGLFAAGLAGFDLLGYLIVFIFDKAGLMDLDHVMLNMALNSIVYLILFCGLLAIINIDIKKLFKGFNKWQPYVAAICCFFAVTAAGIIYSLILKIAGVSISNNDNQTSIETTTGNYPFTAFIIFGLIGPVCEELTYRVGLFSFLKRISKWVAYPVTVLVFALIHFNFEAASLTNELLNLPFYLIAGFALTFVYDNFGFAGSVSAHILNNIISLLPGVAILGVLH